MDNIAILIPCYNEELTIAKVIKDFSKALPKAQIYVYDNNSTDKSIEIVKKFKKVILRHEYKQGKGNVIRRMFREIDAKCYIMVDADDTYPAENAKQMADLVLKNNVDMVVGDRLSSTYFTENKRPFHNFGNTFVRFAINLLFKSNIKDIMTGYRAFSYEFVKTFAVLSKGFEIETEMTIHALDKNMSIENVIVDYRDRPEGSFSKLNTISDGFKVIFTIIRLLRTYKPMVFYGALSILLILLGIIFIIPVISAYIKTGLVARFPTLIVSCFTILTAIISFFSGTILDTIARKDRQDFEMKLIDASKEKVNSLNIKKLNRKK